MSANRIELGWLKTALVISLVIITFLPASAIAEESKQAAPAIAISELNKKTLERKIEQVEHDSELSKDNQASLVSLYRKAISNLETEKARDQATTAYQQAMQDASAQAAVLRSRIIKVKRLVPEETLAVTDSTSIDVLEQLLLKEKADLTAVETNLLKVQEKIKYHTERPQAIREELLDAKKQSGGIAEELKQKATEDRSQPLDEATYWVRESNAHMLFAQIRMLDKELLSQPVRLDLLKAELEKEEHSVQFVTARTMKLEVLLNEKRQQQARLTERMAATARALAEGKHPLVEELANSNTELSNRISVLTQNLKNLEKEEDRVTAEAKRISNDFTSVRQKLEIAGLSQILGQLLQEQRCTGSIESADRLTGAVLRIHNSRSARKVSYCCTTSPSDRWAKSR